MLEMVRNPRVDVRLRRTFAEVSFVRQAHGLRQVARPPLAFPDDVAEPRLSGTFPRCRMGARASCNALALKPACAGLTGVGDAPLAFMEEAAEPAAAQISVLSRGDFEQAVVVGAFGLAIGFARLECLLASRTRGHIFQRAFQP